MKRVILAAAAGCVVIFIWGAFSHLFLLIGSGFTPLPNEDSVLKTLRGSIPEKGLYFFPGKDFRHSTREQEAVFLQKFRTGPVGILVYRPAGGDPFSPGKLLTQLASNFITTLILAIVGAVVVLSYWRRVFLLALLGALACAAVSTIYWNWYEFPASFFWAQVVDQVVGFFLAGLVIVRIVRRSEPKPAE